MVAISDFEGRIHPNINVRKRYLRGDYFGIPQPMELDYDNFLELLKASLFNSVSKSIVLCVVTIS